MRLMLSRFGGVAGIPKQLAQVDTAELSDAERQKLEGLVDKSGFWTLPSELPVHGRPSPDSFGYELAIEDDARRHSVGFDAATQTPELAALVNELKAHARG